jgi:hypothetical protein
MKPRKVTRIERMSMVLRRTTQRATRVLGLVVVAAAVVVLAFAALKSHSKLGVEKPGEALAATLSSQPTLSIEGHWEDAPDHRTLTLGEGAERVPLLSFGRPVTPSPKAILFPPAEKGSWIGRATPDFDELDGIAVAFAAEVQTQSAETGLWHGLKQLFSGESLNPSGSILLMGKPGHFASVSVFASGSESFFQYDLGEQHNNRIVGPPVKGNTRLELVVDRMGRLNAFVGVGNDRRRIGEPVPLGGDWKHAFGGVVPRPSVGCVEGICSFAHSRYSVDREPPPKPQVNVHGPPPKKPPPVVVKKPEPKKTTVTAKKTPH